MAELAIVTFELRDIYNRPRSISFQARTANPTDAQVAALAADLAAITRMGVRSAQVSRPAVIDPTDPEDEANRQTDASLQVFKSDLRDSRGGTYTFTIPHPKVGLINADGTLDKTDNNIGSFLENFDDGAGVAAVVGDWFVSDGEEIIENTDGNNIVAAFMNKK